MTTPYKLAPVIERMDDEFASRPLPERIALTIVAIHQDCAFEMYVQLKGNPIVHEYYESRWKGGYRSNEVRQYCKMADSLMETVWFPTFKRIRAEMNL